MQYVALIQEIWTEYTNSQVPLTVNNLLFECSEHISPEQLETAFSIDQINNLWDILLQNDAPI